MFKVFGFYKFVKVKSLKKNKEFLQRFLILNHIRGTIIIAKEGLNGTISGRSKDIEKTTKKLKFLFSFNISFEQLERKKEKQNNKIGNSELFFLKLIVLFLIFMF